MSGAQKQSWPKRPDGTTDWEAVFEREGTGLIARVDQSSTPEKLRQNTTVVIEKLFTRKADDAEVMRLKAFLEDIVSSPTDLNAKRSDVRNLLRQIKNTRIEKARIYLERKRAGAAIDRRAGWLWKIDFLTKPKVFIPLGLALIVSVSSLVFVVLEKSIGTNSTVVDLETAVVATNEPEPVKAPSPKPQTKPQPTPKPQAPVSKPAPDPAPPPPEPRKNVRVYLQTMNWPTVSFRKETPQKYYAVILEVPNWEAKEAVCAQVPKIRDRLYQIFKRAIPEERVAIEEELRDVKRLTPGTLNKIFPKPYILSADVIRQGEKGFVTAGRPPFCTSPDKPGRS